MTDSKTATELLDGLRDVGNLHEFAELFGFDWYDESDWTWHDVAVKMADDFEQAIAATLGSGECEMEREGEIVATALKLSVWLCSECGSPTYNDMEPFYCQYCGKAVKR